MPRVGAAVLKTRYIQGVTPFHAVIAPAFTGAGTVYISPIDIPWPVIIDRIIYQVGGTAAGNVRAGIYKEGATADSPQGASLVVESASIAQAAAETLQVLTISNAVLIPGQYFIGIQGSNTTGTFYAGYDLTGALTLYYSRAGGYGAFTDPCPTVAALGYTPLFMLRVKENLPAGYRL